MEVTLRIPWDWLEENHWTQCLASIQSVDREIIEGKKRHLERLKILSTCKETGSVSKAAKTNRTTYYYAGNVIRETSVQARKAEKAAIRQKVKELAHQGSSIAEIAKHFGKSYETIRRWVKSSKNHFKTCTCSVLSPGYTDPLPRYRLALSSQGRSGTAHGPA